MDRLLSHAGDILLQLGEAALVQIMYWRTLSRRLPVTLQVRGHETVLAAVYMTGTVQMMLQHRS